MKKTIIVSAVLFTIFTIYLAAMTSIFEVNQDDPVSCLSYTDLYSE